MMSDGNVFDESYGDESDYQSEDNSFNGNLANLMDGNDNDSSFDRENETDKISS